MPDQLSWLLGLAVALRLVAPSLKSVRKSLQELLRIIKLIQAIQGRMSPARKGRCKRKCLPQALAVQATSKRHRKPKAIRSTTSPTSLDE